MGSTEMQSLFSSLVSLFVAQADSAASASSSVKVESVWDFVVKGGPVMIPIGICSFAALTIIVERLVSLRRRNVIPREFIGRISELLEDGNGGGEKAYEHCRRNGSPIALVFADGIKRLGEPIELLERHIQEAGERAVEKLRKHLRLLSVIASVAPLLGLLGTITGMITAFQTVASAAEALGRTELLAKGIYEAMITTAAGLMVAIPTLVAYHGISARVDTLVGEMDRMAVEFIEKYASGTARLAPVSLPAPRRISEVQSSPSDDGRAAVAALAG